MGLFDDILKKPEHTGAQSDPINDMSGGTPTGSTSGGQPPQDDTPIIIQKSSEETLFGGETEVKAESSNIMMSTPIIPQSNEDTNSLIVSTPQAETTPIVTTPTSDPLSTPIVTESITMTTPVIETPTVSAPIIEAVASPTPIVDIAPAPVVTETATPTATTEAVVTPVPVAVAPVAAASIFDSIIAEPVAAPSAPVETQAESTPLANLWGEAPAAVETPTPAPAIETTSLATHNFTTPREFLEKSIANIDVMLGNIDTRYSAKEAEELGYKMEKLRYTELEKTAHTEKLIMDKERDHALSMKKMLEKEIEKDEENKKHITSVESTLEDIGAKHPVHKHHKTEHAQI